MRRLRALLCAALLLGPASALAQAAGLPPLKRGFAQGRFIDDYFGISYATAGLRAVLDSPFLFTGQLASGAIVEVGVRESDESKDAKQWLKEAKASWKEDGTKRRGMKDGVGTYAWARFDRAEADGTMIHHGYAFYPRGYQGFVVHAMIPSDQEGAAEIVTQALAGLRIVDRPGSFYRAHVIAKQTDSDPRQPKVLSQAASAYMDGGNRELAFLAAARAEQIAARMAQAGTLDARTAWQLAFDGGTIFTKAGRHEQAVEYLQRCALLAGSLEDGPAAASACRYQLSRNLAQLDRPNDAFRALASALFGTTDAETLALIEQEARSEPQLRPLHADPRWKRLFP